MEDVTTSVTTLWVATIAPVAAVTCWSDTRCVTVRHTHTHTLLEGSIELSLLCVCVCVSDVDECQDPGMCGTARCVNQDGAYDCLCETGYVYDNNTKTCLGEQYTKNTLLSTDTLYTCNTNYNV